MKTNKEDWLPKEGFEGDYMIVIGWISSVREFKDFTTPLQYLCGGWWYTDGGEAVKKQDKIMGVMPWPEPPVEDSKKDE